MPKRILAIHAHPDDVEILAGGTLALLAERGHQIWIATMTAGDCGSAELPPEQISAIRLEEARTAARMIGAEYRCAGFLDLAVAHDDPSRRRVTEMLREARPDIVLAASPVDYMNDHEAASALVRDACFGAPIPNYRCGDSKPLAAIPHLYYMQPIANEDHDGKLVRPAFAVDIGGVLERKCRMLACHASQREWLRAHHGLDEYLEAMKRWARQLGGLAGWEYAEGFRPYHGHPYPRTPLLEELLEGLVRRLS
jgi:LmbE family N-acetylglucosaminyl deacetylase